MKDCIIIGLGIIAVILGFAAGYFYAEDNRPQR